MLAGDRYRLLDSTFGSHVKIFLLMGRRHSVHNYLFNMNNYAYGDKSLPYKNALVVIYYNPLQINFAVADTFLGNKDVVSRKRSRLHR